eukprot:TRINITY_DN4538_c0_g1_i1.p1 TRINITY_DN4538_c0_g1~~TRINITY_DN4538_c0_g1_i1.p1  ORF type:complete len:144 (+),score=54.69 TRINITY_DN4538_c0_g1_i1:63-434(+)
MCIRDRYQRRVHGELRQIVNKMQRLVSSALKLQRVMTTETRVIRPFSNKFQDRDAAFEKDYFTKDDRKKMKKLMTRLEMESGGTISDLDFKQAEVAKIRKILQSYNIREDNELVEAIYNWKYD